MRFNDKIVLIIAPHPDDEIIGCGGTIIKHRDEIKRLIVVYIVANDTRKAEVMQLKPKLKIDEVYFFDTSDGFVAQSYASICEKLIDIIQAESPDFIFLPFENDAHVDHAATNKISWDAIEKSRYWNNKDWHAEVVFEYEVWSFMNDIGYIESIDNEIENKIKLMKTIYASQLGFDYLSFIKYKNGYRGMLHNRSGYAEVFKVKRY